MGREGSNKGWKRKKEMVKLLHIFRVSTHSTQHWNKWRIINFAVEMFDLLLISAPRLGVYYFLSLTLSVCASVCLSRTNFKIDSSFSFFDGIEPFFDRQFSMTR